MKLLAAVGALVVLLAGCGGAASAAQAPAAPLPLTSRAASAAASAQPAPASASGQVTFYTCTGTAQSGGATCDSKDGAIQVKLIPMTTGVQFSAADQRDHARTPVYVLGLSGNWARITIPHGGTGALGGMAFIVNRYGDGTFAVGSFFTPVQTN